MPDQEIYVIGYEEIVLLLGLLGINGIVVDNNDDFLKEFKYIVENPSIGMIIISMDLSNEIIDFLIEFKLNHKRPFIYYLPDIFKPNIENENIFLKKISEQIKKIIF